MCGMNQSVEYVSHESAYAILSISGKRRYMLENPCISYAARYGVGTISRKSAQAEILRDYTRRIRLRKCFDTPFGSAAFAASLRATPAFALATAGRQHDT